MQAMYCHHRLRTHLPFILLITANIVTSVWLVFRLPGFVTPNEGLHYEYVALIRRSGRLPDLATSTRMDERHQPPLYYSASALFSLPFDRIPLDGDFDSNPFYISTHRGNLNAKLRVNPDTIPVLYIMRLVSMLFGAAGVLASYLAARLLLPAGASLLVAALVAFQPTYLFLSAAANNDLAVAGMSAIVLAYSTWLVIRSPRPLAYVWWGLLLALALLTKASALMLIVLLPVMCVIRWRQGQQYHLRSALACGIWALIGLLPLWSIWLVYNQLRGIDALGLSPSVPLKALFTMQPMYLLVILPELGRLFRSFWLDWSPGEFGYAPDWVYLAAVLFMLVLASGWFIRKKTADRNALLSWLHWPWLVVVVAVFLTIKTLMLHTEGYLTPEGRWLLLIVPSLAWLVGAGWARWEMRMPRVLHFAPAMAFSAAGIALATGYIPILYPQADVLASSSAIPNTSVPVGIRYDDRLELTAIEAGPEVEDQLSAVHLYWRALQVNETDYTVSAQLLVPGQPNWAKLDEQNSFPGNGLNPTRDWQSGVIYHDKVLFQPRGELNGPTRAVVSVSVLYPDTRPLSMTRDGQSLQIPAAREIVVRPATAPTPASAAKLPAAVNFDTVIQLVGLSQTSTATGTTVILWWQASGPVEQGFTAFVHIMDANGQPVAQDDSIPDQGRSPTFIWQPGDGIKDVHRVPAALPADGWLEIGLYDTTTHDRPAASQDGVPLRDNVFRFTPK
jgi:Dolichyl-phosphate-mannose-protein mannosyltransferase